MKKIILFLLLLLVANGCSANSENTTNIFQYKDSYVGDNSAVGNIARQLPNGELLNGFELQTKEVPYGIILKYGESPMTDEALKEIIIINCTFIFALIQNVDWITLDFGDQLYTVTRKEIEDWYGKDIREFENEDSLHTFVQGALDDQNRVNQFFEK